MEPRRFGRERQPLWLRIGDLGALSVLAVIFYLGFQNQGFAWDNTERGLAFFLCSILGAWAAIGWSVGRWSGPAMALGRWALLVLGVALAWFALQMVPLPTGLATKLSPPIAESVNALEATGLEAPRAMPIAQAPERAARSWHQLLAFTAAFAACCLLARRRTTALWLLLLAAAVSLLEGFLAFAHVALGEGGRAFGVLYNPNHSAALAIMAVPLALMAVIRLYEVRRSGYVYGEESGGHGRSDLRLVLFACILIACLGWLATISRGSLSAAALAITAWLAVEVFGGVTRSQREGTATGVEKPALLIGAAALLLLIVSSTAMEGLGERLGRTGMVAGRMELTRATFEGLAETRFLGTGLGATEAMLLRHVQTPTDANPIWSHNDPAQWLAEMGLPGAVLVLLALAGFGRAFMANWQQQIRTFQWSERAIQRAAWVGVIITLAHSLTEFHLRLPLVSFQFAAVLALALNDGTLYLLQPSPPDPSQRRRRKRREKEEPGDEAGAESANPAPDSSRRRRRSSRRRSARPDDAGIPAP